MTESELDDVAGQFRDSTQALREARDKLEGLTSAEESVATSSQALSEASRRIQQFAEEAGRAVERLELVATGASDLLGRTTELLSGNELSELRASVTGLDESLGARLTALEQKALDIERVERDRSDLQRQLEHLKASIAPRHLKKALDSYSG